MNIFSNIKDWGKGILAAILGFISKDAIIMLENNDYGSVQNTLSRDFK